MLPSVFALKLCWPLCVVRVMQPHQRLSFMHHICIIWGAVKEKADATTSEIPHLVGEMPHQVGASLGSLFCGRLAHWAHFRPEGYQQERKFWKVCERELETLLKWHDHFGVTILVWLIWRYYFSMTTLIWSGLFWPDWPTKSLPFDWSECHVYMVYILLEYVIPPTPTL